MNTEKPTEITVMPPATAGPIAAKINISSVSTNMIMWPPSILANSRTVKAAGLVSAPNISMTGMIGSGNFSQSGTSGQKISFQ